MRRIVKLLDVHLYDTVNFEVKKIPHTLYSQFPRKGRTPDIKYTGTI